MKKNRMLIVRRKSEGLLGGMWEFPSGKWGPGMEPENVCRLTIQEQVHLETPPVQFVTRISHAYTHFKIELDIYLCRYVSGRIKLNGPVAHEWVKIDELTRFAFHKANLKFIPKLRQCMANSDNDRIKV